MIRALFISLLLVLAAPTSLSAAVDFDSISELTPGEQYRQLSLLLLVTGGTDPELVNMLQPIVEREAARGQSTVKLSLDDYVTPLIRIVDQDTLLANAAQMYRFAYANQAEIQQRLMGIAQDNPILISMVDVNRIAEDAIIIRTAIAESIEYSDAIDAPGADEKLEAFREQTVYLRNMMEFNQFQEELAVITNEAIIDLGGRLDAYQRMFNEEVDPDLIKRRVESAEIMNQQTGDRYQEQAMMRNTELLMMLILMESQVR